jgi:hypothetical protein
VISWVRSVFSQPASWPTARARVGFGFSPRPGLMVGKRARVRSVLGCVGVRLDWRCKRLLPQSSPRSSRPRLSSQAPAPSARPAAHDHPLIQGKQTRSLHDHRDFRQTFPASAPLAPWLAPTQSPGHRRISYDSGKNRWGPPGRGDPSALKAGVPCARPTSPPSGSSTSVQSLHERLGSTAE